MSDRYEKRFHALRNRGETAFIPFTVLGWPDVETSFQIVKTMIEGGASALELGLAFSDPIADGPVIQVAAHQTISNGFSFANVLELLKQIRELDAQIPIGLLMYYNMILAQGCEEFFRVIAKAGVDSVLIADLPAELSQEVKPAADKNGISLVFIIAPTTTPDRLKKIAANAGAYLYVVSRLGVTGVEQRYDDALKTILADAKKVTSLPLCVGFGISEPAHARQMIALGADGVITGSRIIKIIEETDRKRLHDTLLPYIRAMVEANRQGTYLNK